MEKRNPIISLQFSVRFAKEYLEKLNEMYESHSLEKIQESRNLTIMHKALWVALIIEVGCLFDKYSSKNGDKEVISLFKIDSLKKEINRIFGERIIQKILNTRNTFTAHKGEKKGEVISVEEIRNSKLKKLLDELDAALLSPDIK